MPGSKPRPWRPSPTQRNALGALEALEAVAGRIDATAARVGAYTAQSSDGAAATLTSLVRRGLVSRSGHDGYRLTDAGRAALGGRPRRDQ
jgi:DNA-binding IclR family transcriptional regulator